MTDADAGTVRKLLMLYDFDHTMVQENSDMLVADLVTDKATLLKLRLEVYKTRGWTAYMDAIFEHLFQQGVSQKQINNCLVEGLHLTAGFGPLVELVSAGNAVEQIIISDANSEFIDLFVAHKALSKSFAVVYTNPAVWQDSGRLTVRPYHASTRGGHGCELCPSNLCKGSVVRQHLVSLSGSDAARSVTRVVFVGDGQGDLCPCAQLRPGGLDLACVRRGYALDKLLQRQTKEGSPCPIRADIVYWSDGFELTRLLAERGVVENVANVGAVP